ncbi:hypothetical protein HDU77_009007 [Chytriomyces hyalinus]|nr:hypothetical protein HDU77_009007 [Chytriomyces hyalinus]
MAPQKVTQMTHAYDHDMMRVALEQAHQSPPVESSYCVGAVLAAVDKRTNTATALTTGFSRDLPGNTHAEECCFIKLPEDQKAQLLADENTALVMYTTMEPCGLRLSGKLPCASLILNAGYIKRVVVAIREPPNFVEECTGAQLLQDHGIEVVFMDEYAEAAREPFKHLFK